MAGEKKEITGIFSYLKDSKRYHRFEVQADEAIVGAIYVPKTNKQLPDKIVLTRKQHG